MSYPAKIKAANLSDLARTGGWLPTGAIDETIPSRLAAATATPVSQTLYLIGGVVIPGGRAVSSISFVSVGAAVTPTNQWYCLVDKSLNVLATTIDDLTTAWAATIPKTLLLATALGGATPGGTYTPTDAIEVYLGIMQKAGTPATLREAITSAKLTEIPPIQAATSSTGLTTPGSLGATAGALTAVSTIMYGWVS